jgi:hypothetical protein
MPGKIARSAPRPSFGPPELLVAIHTSRQSCCKAGKSANIHASSGVIWGMSEHRVTELYYPLFSSCRALCRGKA